MTDLSAEKVVAELRSDLAKMPPGEREFWSERLAPIFALIESQRDIIERAKREAQEREDHIAHADAYQKTAMNNLDRAEAAEARVTALEAKKERLRAALRPFATVPRNGAHSGAKYSHSPVFVVDGHELTVGHFRDARAAISEKEQVDV